VLAISDRREEPGEVLIARAAGQAYDYPTRQLLPIAGLIAFCNEKIDLDVDGLRLPRARTHFFK